MTLNYWDKFFFSLRPSLAMGVVRIGIALIFGLWLAVAFNSADTWYGGNGDAIVSVDLARQSLPNAWCVSLLTYSEPSPRLLHIFFSVGFIGCLTLLAGWHSRISAMICLVILQSLMHRNPFIISAADELMSQMLFYVLLSNAGRSLSIDGKNMRARLGDAFSEDGSVWAQRLMQIQICIIYLQTFWFKVMQADWQQGDVLYAVLRTRELTNFPVPGFISGSEEICRILTWAALGIELIVPILIWWAPARRIMMLMAMLFHLIMEYSLTIPFFQPLMIVGLLSFAKAEDYKELGSRLPKLTPSMFSAAQKD